MSHRRQGLPCIPEQTQFGPIESSSITRLGSLDTCLMPSRWGQLSRMEIIEISSTKSPWSKFNRQRKGQNRQSIKCVPFCSSSPASEILRASKRRSIRKRNLNRSYLTTSMAASISRENSQDRQKLEALINFLSFSRVGLGKFEWTWTTMT